MSKKHEPDNFEQMSIFGIMNLLDNTENTLSSDDISKIIDKLSDAKRKRESIEAKKRRQEEREKREREAREAKERKEAHIREVTSMDLPLDWENVFNQDVRTQGVHADSISRSGFGRMTQEKKDLKGFLRTISVVFAEEFLTDRFCGFLICLRR